MKTLPTVLIVDDEVRSLREDCYVTLRALEQALIGAPVRPGEKDPVAVQHIVRSFDPRRVCTVH